MLVDAEKDNLVIEKQRSDVEEKKKIEGEKWKFRSSALQWQNSNYVSLYLCQLGIMNIATLNAS